MQPLATNPPGTRLLDQRIEAALASRGGGPGGGDRNEARLAKLESDVANLAENVKEIRLDQRTTTAELKLLLQRITSVETELKHLPRKGFILTTVLGALSVFGAVILFQHQIQQANGLVASGR